MPVLTVCGGQSEVDNYVGNLVIGGGGGGVGDEVTSRIARVTADFAEL